MFSKKGHKTLKDDIEKLKNSRNEAKRKTNFLRIFVFTLIFLVVCLLLGDLYYIGLFFMCIKLVQYLLAMRRFRRKTEMGKELKSQELNIRTSVEWILLIYLVFVGLMVSVYGVMHYGLHLTRIQFNLMSWLKYSSLLLVFFETYLLRFYRKIEREV